MDLPAPRAAALALILLGGPACRGCLVDDPTYAAAGGGEPTSGTGATSTAATTSSSGDGGASATGTSSASTTSGGEGAGGATGSSTTSTGAGGEGGSAAGCPRSDDFETGLNECWVRMNEADATVNEVAGTIELIPEEGTGWYNEEDGIFVYQDVVGDFTASLRVDAATVAGTYQLAGFLLRDPTQGPEDWIKSEVGRNATHDTPGYVGFTVAGTTTIEYDDPPGPSASVLGVCRRGDSIVLAGNLGAGWFGYGGGVVYEPGADGIPDFPASIQVGFNAASTTGLYVATIDDFRLQVGSDAACLDVLEALWPTR